QEGLLYNLWKQCDKWLRMKVGKNTDLSLERQRHVKDLRDAALVQLALISPLAQKALGLVQEKKNQGSVNYGLKSLEPGYALERKGYLKSNKSSGSSISGSELHDSLKQSGKRFDKMKQKGFGNLSLSDAYKLQEAFPNDLWHVVYMNKMARMKYLV